MWIDHVIYGTADLDSTAQAVCDSLGLMSIAGGRHEGVGTHNRIVPLDGGFIELLAVADREQAERSDLGAALSAAIASDGGLIGWAIGVREVGPTADRLRTRIAEVGRDGMVARLTGVDEALASPALPFFIERTGGPQARVGPRITWLELAADRDQLTRWIGEEPPVPIRFVAGVPGLRAVGIGEAELRP